jgi:uncharacterized protein DUF3313
VKERVIINRRFPDGVLRRRPRTLLIAVALLVMLVAGCSQTVSEQPAVAKEMQGGNFSAANGFFGTDVSLLQPGQEGQAAMVYINSNMQWSQYDKIMLEPVEFWDSLTPRCRLPINIC